jgi:hypothetical protein
MVTMVAVVLRFYFNAICRPKSTILGMVDHGKPWSQTMVTPVFEGSAPGRSRYVRPGNPSLKRNIVID